MQVTGFVVNHPAAHRDRVLQHFVSNAELLERVNPARRERQIDRPPADKVARARVGPSLVKIDLVSAPTEVRRKQTSREPAANENKLRHV